MFCFQCEQAANGKGCTRLGVCGKDAEVAALQDELMEAAKGIALYADGAAKLGARDRAIDVFVVQALFTTLTNVNFDPQRVQEFVSQAQTVTAKAKAMYEKAAKAAGQTPQEMKVWQPENGEPIILRRRKAQGDDITSLQELLTYGLKGMAAYADHAQILGQEDPAVYAYFHHALALLARGEASAADLTAEALKCGEVNIRVMELLDAANTGAYGHPEPTKVRITPVAGKCIVVSGHDLKDLHDLLVQTQGKGINVYTHGEMLPCLAYPALKKFKHLVGNYGGAWQDQAKEFDAFPGSILMTTNCIQKPRDTYKARIFTSGVVAWPGVTHIAAKADGSKDFTPVIQAALAQPGFAADEPEKTIMVGFARNAVLSVAGAVIDAVKAGKIRHFFLVGGCDGAKPGRNYYTEFAQAVPEDCVILTLACGKFRFNKLPFGDIGGIPRLLDVGQCNDSYSAVVIAQALAKAFGVGVNDLPLSLVLSWYEQKACVILLSLLSLGIKNIRLGPTLPAFVTPNVLKVLVDNFNIMPTTTAQNDLAAILK
ncbi:MAG: hydroxylamine reductase [Planctomycetaceae bacterium]